MQGPVPARQLKNVQQHVPETIKFITARGAGLAVLQRPIDQPRPPDYTLRRNKSPIAAVQAVLAIVAEDEVAPARNHQLPALQTMVHLSPPVRLNFHRDAVIRRKIIAKEILLGR